MAILDAETRKSIDERLALHKQIRDSFKGRTYLSQHCRLCNWASNGLTPEEAREANREHEATHPETAQLKASNIDHREIVASLHDHECEMAVCNCKCGCQAGPFCILVFGTSCSDCAIAEGRGHSEHGKKE